MNNALAARVQPFASILHPGIAEMAWPAGAPPFFHDLQLDQVVEAILGDREDDELARYFHAPLSDLDAVAYRQEVMRDLEQAPLMQAVVAFGQRMHAMRGRLARIEKLYCKPEKERWFLEAVALYRDAVTRLAQALESGKPASRGLRALGEYLVTYINAAPFVRLAGEVQALLVELSNIRYGLLIKGNSVTVRPYEGEADYSQAVESTFAKFRHGASRDYLVSFRRVLVGLDHVEAQILDRVALLHPECFHKLETFCATHTQFQDAAIVRFDREVPFYLAYLSYIRKHRQHGLDFCYPALSQSQKDIEVRGAYDLALADKLIAEHRPIVRNDVDLHGRERLLVVSGPNQGGKTTFARMFGQLHYLASLGCPVPGTQAQLFLFDRLFTHFEKEEDIASLRGKLKDDLVRIRAILEAATPDSIVILNEIFSSTTLEDALYLSKRVVAALSSRDLLGVCVTFLAELAALDEKTVSMVGLVDPADPSIRTYRVERRPANGLAYAQAIAHKYRVTGDWLRRRIAS